jgi:SPP1 gp7 family putative phage head morphogenesis protein
VTSPFQIKKQVEQQYALAMKKLTDFFFKTSEPITKPEDLRDILHSASGKPHFKALSESIAARMVTGLLSSSKKGWREAASGGSRGKEIYGLLEEELSGPTGKKVKEIIRENAELISSLPLDLSVKVNKFIQQEVMKGKRTEEIVKALKGKHGLGKLISSRIRLIARTETSKASTALTRVRAEELDLPWYVWRSSKDSRVRSAHNIMDGVLVSWADPPSPEKLDGVKSTLGNYHAGDCPNCRCYSEPIVSLDQVNWPAKVYHNGSIIKMTRYQFRKILPQVAA